MAIDYLITLRASVDETTGDQGVSLILGGAHRGGVTEARWGFAGGLGTDLALDIQREVMQALAFMLSHGRADGQMMLL